MDRARLIVLLLVSSCAPRVPTPVLTDHEGEMPIAVPHPPLAARAEVIPPQPNENSVWVDGYWMWKGEAYSWNAGRWVVPGPGLAYAPATLLRLRNGTLVFYPPKWKRAAEKE